MQLQVHLFASQVLLSPPPIPGKCHNLLFKTIMKWITNKQKLLSKKQSTAYHIRQKLFIGIRFQHNSLKPFFFFLSQLHYFSFHQFLAYPSQIPSFFFFLLFPKAKKKSVKKQLFKMQMKKNLPLFKLRLPNTTIFFLIAKNQLICTLK